MSLSSNRFFQKFAAPIFGLCVVSCLNMATSAHASGFNDRFTYSPACQHAAAALKDAYSRGSPTKAAGQRQLDTKNLFEDLGNLDAQVKIITDRSEEIDFRYQVVRTAETSRQSILYSMDRIRQFAPQEADGIERLCGLSKIKAPFEWPQLVEDLEKSFSAPAGSSDGAKDSSATRAE